MKDVNIYIHNRVIILAHSRTLKNIFDYSFIEEEILNLLVFPALFYLTFQLSSHNKVFKYLGAISFGLYAYQHVPRLMRILKIGNVWIYFIIVVAMAVATCSRLNSLVRFWAISSIRIMSCL